MKSQTKLRIKFKRSETFPNVIYSKQVPHKLIEFEDGVYRIRHGQVYESEKQYVCGKKIISTYTRLDNAKIALQRMFATHIDF